MKINSITKISKNLYLEKDFQLINIALTNINNRYQSILSHDLTVFQLPKEQLKDLENSVNDLFIS